ncbi:hypothetical protein OESDEN_05048, partial [Oesophagostomum dentatum]
MQFVLLLLLAGLVRTENVRMNCHPEPSATKQKCEQRGCIWDPKNSPVGIPPCYFKEGVGYKQGYSNADTITLYKNSGPKNPWGDDIPQINFTSKRIGKTLNIRIYVYGRYEPPLQLPANPSSSDEDLMNFVSSVILSQKGFSSSRFLQLSTQSMDDLFSFKVIRKSTQTSLFDTSLGGLIFSDKFIQLAAILPSDKIFGCQFLKKCLTLSSVTLQHNFERYTTWAMLARDEFPLSHGLHTNNLYGKFLKLSRYGYKDLEDMKEKVGRNVKAGIPLDTIVADIDYMDKNKDFTIGEVRIPVFNFVQEPKSKGMKAITIYDNAIQVDYEPFERAVNM